MWIDDDFPVLSNAFRYGKEMAIRDYRAEAEAEVTRRQARIEERKLAAERDFAQISAHRQVTGYDRNVMRQWIEAGACGRRPMLSFELQEGWKSEQELEIDRRARSLELQAIAHEAAEKAKRLKAAKTFKSQKVAAARAVWDMEHPEVAGARDVRKATVSARRLEEEMERRRQREHKELLLQISSKIRAGGKTALLELSEEEFDLWCSEIATIEQLDAFGADLFRDGVKARHRDGPWLWRVVRQAMDESAAEVP